MRVLHIISGLEGGGAEHMLARLLPLLRRHGEPSAVLVLGADGPVGPLLRQAGIPLHIAGLPHSGWRGCLALWRACRRFRPDIIQTWMVHADLVGGLLARWTGLPLIWGLRNDHFGSADLRLPTRWAYRLAACLSGRWPRAVLCCSQAVRLAAQRAGYASERLRVIENGVDPCVFVPAEAARRRLRQAWRLHDGPLLIHVARLHAQKDHGTLVAALQIACDRRPDLQAVLVGEGVDERAPVLAPLIGHPRLRLLGRRGDVAACYAAADLATLCSRHEGFPNAVVEAMACGLPCVVTPAGAAADIVGDTGRVVPIGDAEALAAAWLDVLRGDVGALGHRARQRAVARYGLDHVVCRYAALHALCAQRAERAQKGGLRRLLFVVNDPRTFLSHRLPVPAAALAGGWEVHVATPARSAVATIRALGFVVHLLPLDRRSVDPRGALATMAAIRSLVTRIRPDLVHLCYVKPVVIGGLALRGLPGRPPLVAQFMGLGWLFQQAVPAARCLQALLRWPMRVALAGPRCAVIAQNGDDRTTLVNAGLVESRRCLVIQGSGIALEHFPYRPEEELPAVPEVLLATRMLWAKGVADFVEAARILQRRGRRLRCVLVGDADPDNRGSVPEARLRAWHAEGLVSWEGHCSTMAARLARAHVVCLPSYYGEGLPRVLLEAMAVGRGVIASDAPGCRALVQHERTGLLVPPRDAAALAHAIERMIDEPVLRQGCVAAARGLVERHHRQEHIAERTLRCYEHLVHQPHAVDAAAGDGVALSRSGGTR